MADDPYAPQRQAGVAEDIPAPHGPVASLKRLKESVPLADGRGYSGDRRIPSVPEAQQDQGCGDPAAFVAAVSNASREPGDEPDEPGPIRLERIQECLHHGWRAVAHPEQVRDAPVSELPEGDRARIVP